MKKIFKKENVMPVVILGIICIVVAALMAGVNMITKPKIEEREQQILREKLSVVLPGSDDFESIQLNDKYPEEINSAYKSSNGYAFETSVRGKEGMKVLCGVDNDGKLVKIDIISEQETPGYKDGVFNLVLGDDGVYNGKDSSDVEPELVSGATLTSGAIYDAVKASLDGYVIATGGELSNEPEVDPKKEFMKSEEELLPLIGELVPASSGFEALKLDKEYENLAGIYTDKSGDGYVAYLLVINERYGRVETETLVHVGADGKIKNIGRLVWKTSDAGWGYEPPAEELVADFYDSLIGADINKLHTLLGIEENTDGMLVTNATTTSKGLLSAIVEGMENADAVVKANTETDYTPKTVGIIIIAVSLASVCAVVIFKAVKRRKNG